MSTYSIYHSYTTTFPRPFDVHPLSALTSHTPPPTYHYPPLPPLVNSCITLPLWSPVYSLSIRPLPVPWCISPLCAPLSPPLHSPLLPSLASASVSSRFLVFISSIFPPVSFCPVYPLSLSLSLLPLIYPSHCPSSLIDLFSPPSFLFHLLPIF